MKSLRASPPGPLAQLQQTLKLHEVTSPPLLVLKQGVHPFWRLALGDIHTPLWARLMTSD
jgi:hypothetical protein